jgi:hypothetical protein
LSLVADVQHLLAGGRRQLGDDPVQPAGREPLVGERARLDRELLAHGGVV